MRPQNVARAAALILLGLALLHVYGILFYVYSVFTDARFCSVFLIPYDSGRYSFEAERIEMAAALFCTVYALRWLIAGLWSTRRWAWFGSIVACCLLLRWRVLFLQQAQSRWPLRDDPVAFTLNVLVLAYVVLALFLVLASTPAFFPRKIPNEKTPLNPSPSS